MRVRRTAGFSLVETLVVVAIVGVLALAATLALSGAGGERQLDEASHRFAGLVAFACERAELTGRDIGTVLTRDGYRFDGLDGDAWRALAGASELRARQWPDGSIVTLARDGRPAGLATREDARPQIICRASGAMTPFVLTLALPSVAARYRVDGAVDGTVVPRRVGDNR